jgi:hypothetical protein
VLANVHAVLKFLLTHKELLQTISVTAGLTALLFKGWPKLIVRRRERTRRRRLERTLNAADYTHQDIERAVIYYIDPECQVVDPSGAEDFRLVYPVRQNLFAVVDDLLNKRAANRFSLLLADTGMGKTSFLLNYYARHWQQHSRRHSFSITLIPLGIGDALAKIPLVANKTETVLFLDALDEDTRAIEDHKKRFRDLVAASSQFRHVLVSCRTQFFPREDEIPKEVGIIRVGPIGPGDSREYTVNKLYLSPFSEEQIQHYLRRMFPFGQRRKRRKALALVKKIDDLPARPMLLAQVQSILSLGEECQYSFQIYEQMIQSWLNRERGIAEPAALRDFCECLAVDIFQNRKQRGAERISESELSGLATRFGVQLPRIEHIRTRSLLNRDAQGNLKFAHRSIMEYLFVARFRRFPASTPRLEWTDQMKRFFWETSFDAWEKSKDPIEFGKADLSGSEHLPLKPVISLRNLPRVLSDQDRSRLPSIAQESAARVARAPHFYRVADLPVVKDDLSSNGPRFHDAGGVIVLLDDLRLSAPGLYRRSSDGRVVIRLPKNFDWPGDTIRYLCTRLGSNRAKIVVDHALGLVWEVPGEGHETWPESLEGRCEVLSAQNVGGFGTWRLPTLEEAFSFAHLSRCEEYYPLFKGLIDRIWTADTIGIQRLSLNVQTLEIRIEGFSHPSFNWPRAVCVASTKGGRG